MKTLYSSLLVSLKLKYSLVAAINVVTVIRFCLYFRLLYKSYFTCTCNLGPYLLCRHLVVCVQVYHSPKLPTSFLVKCYGSTCLPLMWVCKCVWLRLVFCACSCTCAPNDIVTLMYIHIHPPCHLWRKFNILLVRDLKQKMGVANIVDAILANATYLLVSAFSGCFSSGHLHKTYICVH